MKLLIRCKDGRAEIKVVDESGTEHDLRDVEYVDLHVDSQGVTADLRMIAMDVEIGMNVTAVSMSDRAFMHAYMDDRGVTKAVMQEKATIKERPNWKS